MTACFHEQGKNFLRMPVHLTVPLLCLWLIAEWHCFAIPRFFTYFVGWWILKKKKITKLIISLQFWSFFFFEFSLISLNFTNFMKFIVVMSQCTCGKLESLVAVEWRACWPCPARTAGQGCEPGNLAVLPSCALLLSCFLQFSLIWSQVAGFPGFSFPWLRY